MNEYFENPMYQVKRPSNENKNGNNIYHEENGIWIRLHNNLHNKDDMDHDLESTNVLICDDFWYFGDKAPLLPENLLGIVKKGVGIKI